MERKRVLRDPEDIKSRVTGDICKLNKRLLEVAVRLDAELRAHRVARTPPGRILTSFYRKAVNTFKAIQALKERRLIEEGWILLRVLLETHVNGRPKERRELLRLRREQLEANQNMLLGRLSYLVAEFIKSSLASVELMLLGLGYEKFRDRTSGPLEREQREEPDPPGAFWIWRE